MSYFTLLATILLAYMSLWFVVSILKQRNDVADVAWGLGFVLMAWSAFFLSETAGVRGLVVSALVTLWGTRLSWHIYLRNKGKVEDYRYAKWRTNWGKWFYPRSYVQVFLLQGVLLYMIVFPVLITQARADVPLGFFDALGVALWLVGFYFEVVGDAQLARFIKNPANKGKLLQSGLWRYTRHPNYFGEVLQWWGLWVVALSVPYGWVGIIGPITITVLILKVSGVPLLEAKMAEHPDFAEYKRRTSVFVPWFPKK